ncbi:hypothetical protein SAMN05192566_1559 [Methylophilus rhizosphaerae]|uniref:Uncharacterized protein n=1 Tax=Methylophilus rhizosphaerae TaxID=492660 RepID=A0A1G9CPT6_9PROT|nr:hypothetical protein [Methylophilus rhizosphaerae]SDK53464.1 hypothetical protein SAMN05192566_1559 [Methylophilus rhizosphaerae]
MCIANQNYIIQAIEAVLTWDISDDAVSSAVADQAKLMAGFDCEQSYLDIQQ